MELDRIGIMLKSNSLVLTLPLGDHLETPAAMPAPTDAAVANWWTSVADAPAPAPVPTAGPAPADAAAAEDVAVLAAGATTAVEVLLPVAVPAVVLPTLEALLPLLPALLPPTAWLKFIDEQPRSIRWRSVLDWWVPSLKYLRLRENCIGWLDWIGSVWFVLVWFGDGRIVVVLMRLITIASHQRTKNTDAQTANCDCDSDCGTHESKCQKSGHKIWLKFNVRSAH